MCLLWARPYAKFFQYNIPFSLPNQPRREVFSSPCFKWGNGSPSLRSHSRGELSRGPKVGPTDSRALLLVVSIHGCGNKPCGLVCHLLDLRGIPWHFKEGNPRARILIPSSTSGIPSLGRQSRMKHNRFKKSLSSTSSSLQQVLTEALLCIKHGARHWVLSSESISQGRKEGLGWAFPAFLAWTYAGQGCFQKRSLFLSWHSEHDKPQIWHVSFRLNLTVYVWEVAHLDYGYGSLNTWRKQH